MRVKNPGSCCWLKSVGNKGVLKNGLMCKIAVKNIILFPMF